MSTRRANDTFGGSIWCTNCLETLPSKDHWCWSRNRTRSNSANLEFRNILLVMDEERENIANRGGGLTSVREFVDRLNLRLTISGLFLLTRRRPSLWKQPMPVNFSSRYRSSFGTSESAEQRQSGNWKAVQSNKIFRHEIGSDRNDSKKPIGLDKDATSILPKPLS